MGKITDKVDVIVGLTDPGHFDFVDPIYKELKKEAYLLDYIKENKLIHTSFAINRDETFTYYLYCGDKKVEISEFDYKVFKEALK